MKILYCVQNDKTFPSLRAAFARQSGFWPSHRGDWEPYSRCIAAWSKGYRLRWMRGSCNPLLAQASVAPCPFLSFSVSRVGAACAFFAKSAQCLSCPGFRRERRNAIRIFVLIPRRGAGRRSASPVLVIFLIPGRGVIRYVPARYLPGFRRERRNAFRLFRSLREASATKQSVVDATENQIAAQRRLAMTKKMGASTYPHQSAAHACKEVRIRRWHPASPRGKPKKAGFSVIREASATNQSGFVGGLHHHLQGKYLKVHNVFLKLVIN